MAATTTTSQYRRDDKAETSPSAVMVEDIVTKIDTFHNDEAVKVLVEHDGDEHWTDKEETRLRRKIDRRLMPILCITYALQYYDKSMLGQAVRLRHISILGRPSDGNKAIFGLVKDLNLIGRRYSFASAIFYLGFIAGAWPSMIIAQRYPVERVASMMVIIWGVCLALTVLCSDYRGIYAQRFFLGFLESGVSPMFMLIVVSLLPDLSLVRLN